MSDEEPKTFKSMPLKRRVRTMLRMLDGENLEDLSEELGLPVEELTKWKRIFRKRSRQQEPAAGQITPESMTRAEAAKYIGSSVQTLGNWATTKKYAIPYTRIGKSTRYKKADLDEFIKLRTVGA